MLRIVLVVFLASICIEFASAQEHPDAVPSILPAPQHITGKKGVFKIG